MEEVILAELIGSDAMWQQFVSDRGIGMHRFSFNDSMAKWHNNAFELNTTIDSSFLKIIETDERHPYWTAYLFRDSVFRAECSNAEQKKLESARIADTTTYNLRSVMSSGVLAKMPIQSDSSFRISFFRPFIFDDQQKAIAGAIVYYPNSFDGGQNICAVRYFLLKHKGEKYQITHTWQHFFN
ncbi:MAG: hypothetical protein MUF62_06945 [Chitinophagaceae bacterium]|nr:hypothetical protein [Chitinophagaceae bacterium]